MNPLLNYVIQVIIVSGLLYSYYHWVLRNKKFHRYNRYYLLGAALLSILIPLLNIPVYFTEEEAASSIVYSTLTVFAGEAPEEAVVVYTNTGDKSGWFTWNHILQLIYILVATLVLIRIIFSLLKIRRIVRRHTVEQIGRIRFMNTDEPGTPYSFFSWLFWNRKIELNSEKGEQIFRHELFHIQQKHSLDILFFEFLSVVGWFNPFFHLMKRETKAIHEFLADQFAITENNRWDYAELLLMQVLNTNQQLVHPFFHNQIKRRIAMITSPQKTSHQYLRKLMVLPVTAIAVMLFAFSYKSNHSSIANPVNQKLILIDIGHGGADHGAIGPEGTKEKDLALSIANHIKELNKNLGFNIEFTREGDLLPDLKARIKAGEEQPSLFLSLHINSSPDNNRSGIEVYIPNNGHPFRSESQRLGAALLNQLQKVYTVENKLLQRSKSVWVLENSNCPSALLEAGYISNNNDLRFFTKSDNQKLVAQKILSAISAFLNQDFDKNNSINNNPDTTIKPSYKIATFDNIVIVSDSIIYKSSPSKAPKKNTPESIVIMNGKRISKIDYTNKTILCDSFEYYEPGDKKAIELYGPDAKAGVMIIHNGKITDTEFEIKEATKPEAEKVFSKVEIEAAFPGGMDAWRKYLERNLNAQIPILKKAPSGTYTVIIQFIVNLDGSVNDARALTNHGYGMEEEAIRAIEKGPKWLAAIQNGRQVKAYRKQPITFVVDNGPRKEGTVASGQGKVLNEVVMVGYTEPTNPTFPGGDSAWKKYLAANANSLVPANNGAPEGQYKTRIQFIVHPDGSISDITALTHFGYGMEEEAIRVIKNSPRWIPATREGTKVSSYKEQSFTFIITSEPDKPNYPPVIPENQSSHILTIKELKNIDIYRLLQLPKGTEIISYVFTIDGDRDAIEVPNTGSQINQKTRELLNNAIAGKMITVDMIRIRAWDEQKKEFYIKKIPSAVWYLKD